MLLLFSPETTPRVSFAFKLILTCLLELPFQITTDKDEFKKHTGLKLVYGDTPDLNAPCIPASTLLFEREIHTQHLEISQWNGLPVFFRIDCQNKFFPFDIFAASFFLATRYEEYLPHATDKHGRFQFQNSLAYQHAFLEIPLINLWAEEFKKALQNLYPTLLFKSRQFEFIPTYDIDIAYAYKGRSLSRTFQACIKNLFKGEFKQLLERWPVLAGARKDPYDTFSLQYKLQQQYHLHTYYFILCGTYGPYDKNLSIQNSSIQRDLIKLLAKNSQLGLHPSYASKNNINKIKQEKNVLEELVGKPIIISRQHFLKLKFPDTYRSLIDSGIKEDYSMGYPDHIGFRASICTPYPFYDLQEGKETALMLYPLAVMDSTLKDYMGLNAHESIARIKAIIDQIYNVNGLFISVWHNHSLNEDGPWKGWLKVYEEMIKYSTERAQ